ncbi:Nuclear protein MDM1 [Trinorchestia longiramus]|nr:Nuclear protein MDM1 [Trinorchestia longiramus]
MRRLNKSTIDLTRDCTDLSEERSPRRVLRPAPRSKSEGPLACDIDEYIFRGSEYKTQFAKGNKPVVKGPVKCSIRSLGRGPETTPLLLPEKPAAPSSSATRVQQPAHQTLANGTAGGSVVKEGVRQEATQPSPRKSKSMGRISQDRSAGGGTQDNRTEGGVGTSEAPATKAPETGSGSEQTKKVEPTPWAGYGHRRVPSDGVAWRRSKGLEADLQKAAMEDSAQDNRTYKSEYRKKFRPFSQYQYVDGKFHIKAEEPAAGAASGAAAAGAASGGGVTDGNWYKEVIELRKQAGQYRARQDFGGMWRAVQQHRGWGVEMASERLTEIYNQQAELWEQVSRRSSLQALSLASASPSSRPISKAEKEIVNSRRSSPIKHMAAKDRPSTAPSKPKPVGVHKAGDKTDGRSSKEVTPRHHYERTTGSGEEGLLITSPSRDNIEPVVTEWNRRSSRKTPPVTSPVKDSVGRRRPPARSSANARPPRTKDNNTSHRLTVGRSVSVDPQSRSPKRNSRPPAGHAPPVPKAERRPRPTSLATSARRKGADSSGRPPLEDSKKASRKSIDPSASPKKGDLKSREDKRRSSDDGEAKKDKEKEVSIKDGPKDAGMEAVKEASLTGRKSTPEPRFDPEKYEPVVKTPPEPTRVKSPDQVMVKSPDPVNWTVPLDTGKTFTVTHNIPEGESSRATPSSEHRQPFETRPRQTPEPTKIYQGSLAGTPITTASTVAAAAAPEDVKAASQQGDKAVSSKFDPIAVAGKTVGPELKKEERTLPDIPEAKPDENGVSEEKADSVVKASSKDQPKMEPIPESMTSSVISDIPSSPALPPAGISVGTNELHAVSQGLHDTGSLNDDESLVTDSLADEAENIIELLAKETYTLTENSNEFTVKSDLAFAHSPGSDLHDDSKSHSVIPEEIRTSDNDEKKHDSSSMTDSNAILTKPAEDGQNVVTGDSDLNEHDLSITGLLKENSQTNISSNYCQGEVETEKAETLTRLAAADEVHGSGNARETEDSVHMNSSEVDNDINELEHPIDYGNQPHDNNEESRLSEPSESIPADMITDDHERLSVNESELQQNDVNSFEYIHAGKDTTVMASTFESSDITQTRNNEELNDQIEREFNMEIKTSENSSDFDKDKEINIQTQLREDLGASQAIADDFHEDFASQLSIASSETQKDRVDDEMFDPEVHRYEKTANEDSSSIASTDVTDRSDCEGNRIDFQTEIQNSRDDDRPSSPVEVLTNSEPALSDGEKEDTSEIHEIIGSSNNIADDEAAPNIDVLEDSEVKLISKYTLDQSPYDSSEARIQEEATPGLSVENSAQDLHAESTDISQSTIISKSLELSQLDEIPKFDELPQFGEIPQSIEIPQPVEINQSVEIPQSIEIPQPVEINQSVEIPQSIEIPQPVEINQSVEIPQSIEISQSHEISQPVEIPQSDEIFQSDEIPQPSIEIAHSFETPQSVDLPSTVEIPLSMEIAQSMETSESLNTVQSAEGLQPIRNVEPFDTFQSSDSFPSVNAHHSIDRSSSAETLSSLDVPPSLDVHATEDAPQLVNAFQSVDNVQSTDAFVSFDALHAVDAPTSVNDLQHVEAPLTSDTFLLEGSSQDVDIHQSVLTTQNDVVQDTNGYQAADTIVARDSGNNAQDSDDANQDNTMDSADFSTHSVDDATHSVDAAEPIDSDQSLSIDRSVDSPSLDFTQSQKSDICDQHLSGNDVQNDHHTVQNDSGESDLDDASQSSVTLIKEPHGFSNSIHSTSITESEHGMKKKEVHFSDLPSLNETDVTDKDLERTIRDLSPDNENNLHSNTPEENTFSLKTHAEQDISFSDEMENAHIRQFDLKDQSSPKTLDHGGSPHEEDESYTVLSKQPHFNLEFPREHSYSAVNEVDASHDNSSPRTEDHKNSEEIEWSSKTAYPVDERYDILEDNHSSKFDENETTAHDRQLATIVDELVTAPQNNHTECFSDFDHDADSSSFNVSQSSHIDDQSIRSNISIVEENDTEEKAESEMTSLGIDSMTDGEIEAESIFTKDDLCSDLSSGQRGGSALSVLSNSSDGKDILHERMQSSPESQESKTPEAQAIEDDHKIMLQPSNESQSILKELSSQLVETEREVLSDSISMESSRELDVISNNFQSEAESFDGGSENFTNLQPGLDIVQKKMNSNYSSESDEDQSDLNATKNVFDENTRAFDSNVGFENFYKRQELHREGSSEESTNTKTLLESAPETTTVERMNFHETVSPTSEVPNKLWTNEANNIHNDYFPHSQSDHAAEMTFNGAQTAYSIAPNDASDFQFIHAAHFSNTESNSVNQPEKKLEPHSQDAFHENKFDNEVEGSFEVKSSETLLTDTNFDDGSRKTTTTMAVDFPSGLSEESKMNLFSTNFHQIEDKPKLNGRSEPQFLQDDITDGVSNGHAEFASSEILHPARDEESSPVAYNSGDEACSEVSYEGTTVAGMYDIHGKSQIATQEGNPMKMVLENFMTPDIPEYRNGSANYSGVTEFDDDATKSSDFSHEYLENVRTNEGTTHLDNFSTGVHSGYASSDIPSDSAIEPKVEGSLPLRTELANISRVSDLYGIEDSELPDGVLSGTNTLRRSSHNPFSDY